MEKLSFGFDDESATCDTMQTRPQKSYVFEIIKNLEHASQCREEKCTFSPCQRVKVYLQDVKRCRGGKNGDCSSCKFYFILCGYHAKCCQKAKCPLPFCSYMKMKIKKYCQMSQRRLQQILIVKQQLDVQQCQGMLDAVLKNSPWNSNSSIQPSPGAQQHLLLYSPPVDVITLQKDLKDLLLSGDDHDVIIKVKGREYKVHKSILRARCSAFSAMFKHKMKVHSQQKIYAMLLPWQ